MSSLIHKTAKYIKILTAILVMVVASPASAWAGSPPAPSLFSNPLAVTFLILMTLLLIIIAVLANILLGAADVRTKKTKKNKAASATILSLLFLLITSAAAAQGETEIAKAAGTIGGMSSSSFYIMAAVIFLELFIILVLLINIKLLLKTESDKVSAELETEKIKKPVSNWWTKINSFKPVEQEADIDLGHDYDGIRELDNRLPPWWIYGFYITIIVSAVYLWRYHVSHTAPLMIQEYETAIAQADIQVKEYLKQKGESVDENTVTLLTSTDDIAAGKKIFTVSCVSCHKETGAGDVGPNLTDDYWMHGGDVKSVFKTIKYGINAMPQWQNAYSNKQIAQITSFIKTLHGTNPPNAKAPQGEEYKEDNNNTAKPAADSAAQKETKEAL